MALLGARAGPRTGQSTSFLADKCLGAVARKLLVIRRVLSSYGSAPLRDYVAHLHRYSARSCQDRADLSDIVRAYLVPLLGEAVAERVANDLLHRPIALTANHHGVDFFAQSVQSSLLFSLGEGACGDAMQTLPVFACGTVPLNNITFPRGLLLYTAEHGSKEFPLKLPIFPDRCKRDLVCTSGPFDQAMLDRAEQRAQRLFNGVEKISGVQAATREILGAEFAHPEVLARPTYSEQAVMLNHRLWKRLYKDPSMARDLVYLELEHVAARLLCRDLMDAGSLAFRVFFDTTVRDSVLTTLDGHRACWDLDALRARLDETSERPTGCRSNAVGGTVFFWALDERKRRIPLVLDGRGEFSLVGPGKGSKQIRIPFSAEALCDGLVNGTLMPALFSSYLVIALARGVTCLGGYYQAGYLPIMQCAVVGALQRSTRYKALADSVATVPTNSYLSGMQAVMSLSGADALAPAGILEIIAGGGLSVCDLERMGAVSVRSAHLASIAETVLDVAPELADSDDWFSRVGTDLYRVLQTEVVFK